MNAASRRLLPIVFALLALGASSVRAAWVENGAAVCAVTMDQIWPAAAPSGSGGAIITWWDTRPGGVGLWAQRVTRGGVPLWAADGVPLCIQTGVQSDYRIISDGAGGAIIAWQAWLVDNMEIYAQRIDSSGTVLWGPNGVAVCTASGDQRDPRLVSDGAGGTIITWYDFRGGIFEIYAQRVNAAGVAQWTANGVDLCTASGPREQPDIASDGAGGAIVTWDDYRNGNWEIYAQRIAPDGSLLWPSDGVGICTGVVGAQEAPRIAPDGSGGAMIAWTGYRSIYFAVFAQRVSASGSSAWTPNGVVACNAGNAEPSIPVLVPDGSGGAILAWTDFRVGDQSDIYAQRISGAGTVMWAANGVAVCTSSMEQNDPQLVSDGFGGALITWWDTRNNGSSVYTQRVLSNGSAAWMANGVAVCTIGGPASPSIASNGSGGAIIAWPDMRNGFNYDVFAQRIDACGYWGVQEPAILSVKDVRHDQGGWVDIHALRSLHDVAFDTELITGYNVWRRIIPAQLSEEAQGAGVAAGSAGVGAAASSAASGAAASSATGAFARILTAPERSREVVLSRAEAASLGFPPGAWQSLGFNAATQQEYYDFLVPTRNDSSASGTAREVFVITAHTPYPSYYFVSNADSGCSVDDLAPDPPRNLAGEQEYDPAGLSLTWDPSAATDLWHYAIYRGTSPGFVPSHANLIASPAGTSYVDAAWRWSGGYSYKVSAIDRHGNESSFALLTPSAVTGADTPIAPAATYLAQNYPNPFNPMTRIAFGLSAPGTVSLRIYDVSGRLVRVLVEGLRPAGTYAEIWDGRDSLGRDVASGIYFYRFRASGFDETKKMALTR
jgi:hypothetical protein